MQSVNGLKKKLRRGANPNPVLRIRSKLNIFSRLGVNMFNLLNLQGLPFSLDAFFFTTRSLGIKNPPFDYHFYQLFWKDYEKHPKAYNLLHMHQRFQ